MQAELRECPFCGETPTSRCPTPGTSQDAHRAVCMTEGCALYLCSIPADQWNTRPIPTPADLAKWEALREAGLELSHRIKTAHLDMGGNHKYNIDAKGMRAVERFRDALAALAPKEQG
jgi:hypothetical protein